MEMPQAKSSKQNKASSPSSKTTRKQPSQAFEAGEESSNSTMEAEGGIAQAKTTDSAEALASMEGEESAEGEEKMCRYCFCGTEEGELISPCECKGGQRYVHLHCLRRWQRMVLVSQPTHPVSVTSI